MRESLKFRAQKVTVPPILQMEAVECGAASLAMMLAYHKCYVPLAELRQACGVSRDGSKASNVLAAARRYGMEAKGYKKELADLFQLPVPFIVFWNFNHFLVVEGFDSKWVHLTDPAAGPRQVDHEAFDEGYTGVVLLLKPTADFKRLGRPPEVWPAIRERFAHAWNELGFISAAGLLLVLPTLAMPVFTQVFVDEVLVHGFKDWLRPLLLGMGLAAILTAALKALQLQVLAALRLKLGIATAGRFVWHLLRLPAAFYGQRFAGEVSGRVAIADSVAKTLAGPLATALVDGVMLLFYTLAMLAYDPFLASIAIALSAINLVAMLWQQKQLELGTLKVATDQGRAGGVAVSGLQSIETLKASGLESDFFARWAGHQARGTTSQQKLALKTQLQSVVPTMLQGLGSLSILALGGMRVMDGHLTIGTLVGFQALMGAYMGPVGRLMSLGPTFTQLKAGLSRLDDVLATPTRPDLGHVSVLGPEEPLRLSGHLEFRQVSFGYNPTAAALIEGLDVVVAPGRRVAFVGGSGSGKSTVAKLASGLYEPWSGELLLDGRPMAQVPRAVRTASVAMVDQDVFLFGGSIRDNLSMWDPTITDHDLMRALEDADLADLVMGMPGGLDAEMLEGAANLSGGQRQRLELARALVRDPAILILDEATSALDSESERIVDRRLRRRGCTCLIVAHRLSTIRDADEIIYLHRGKVMQRGSHDQLKAMDGPYARLIRAEGALEQEKPA